MTEVPRGLELELVDSVAHLSGEVAAPTLHGPQTESFLRANPQLLRSRTMRCLALLAAGRFLELLLYSAYDQLLLV